MRFSFVQCAAASTLLIAWLALGSPRACANYVSAASLTERADSAALSSALFSGGWGWMREGETTANNRAEERPTHRSDKSSSDLPYLLSKLLLTGRQFEFAGSAGGSTGTYVPGNPSTPSSGLCTPSVPPLPPRVVWLRWQRTLGSPSALSQGFFHPPRMTMPV